jgi:hypothetical protein
MVVSDSVSVNVVKSEVVIMLVVVLVEVVVVKMLVVVMVEVVVVVVSGIDFGWTMGIGVEISEKFIWAVKLTGNDAVINGSFEVNFSFVDFVNDKASLYVIASNVDKLKPKLKLCSLFILFKSFHTYLFS